MDSPWITQCLSLEHLFSLGALGLLAGLLPPGGGLSNTKKKLFLMFFFYNALSDCQAEMWTFHLPGESTLHGSRIQRLPTVTQQQAELTGGAGAGAAGVALSERDNFSWKLCKVFTPRRTKALAVCRGRTFAPWIWRPGGASRRRSVRKETNLVISRQVPHLSWSFAIFLAISKIPRQ